MIDVNWIPCRDKDTNFYYWVKETRKNNEFELVFSFYPKFEKGWEHGGVKFIARTLRGFLNSRYYKKYQSERVVENEN